jgi:signal recognition particle subunit SRP54
MVENMFEGLSQKLTHVFSGLRKKGRLSEEDVNLALREIRIALLEADVALSVVKDCVQKIKEKAIGQEIVKNIAPAQMVVKIVHDHLVEMLGQESEPLKIAGSPPIPMMLVGLQGAGKTTFTAKLAKRLTTKNRKKVLMASLDVQRPAAQEQLAVLGEQTQITTLPIIKGQSPVQITERALKMAREEGYDILLLDTAGRLHINDELMGELQTVKKIANPHEILLVADALTGQDAVNIAEIFHQKLDLSGIVLSRIDGDARGGAALSMRAITGCPIKFLSTGEKVDALEEFHPSRIADRILDMGDIVSLVEQAAENIDQEEAQKMAAKMQKGQFDLYDLLAQFKQLKKMGGLMGFMKFLPGMGDIKKLMSDQKIDDKMIARQEAIIYSMTPGERHNPKILNASRKKRIALGSGTEPKDINQLLKKFEDAQKMMKQMTKLGKKGMLTKPPFLRQ